MNLELSSWQDVLKIVIMLVIAAAGAPVTQLIKNVFKSLFNVTVEDRAALALTAVVAGVFAVLEMWLSGVLVFSSITLESFPATFFAVFSVATLYYGWLKGSESVFGKKLVLKKL
jgi:hypothetical protein